MKTKTKSLITPLLATCLFTGVAHSASFSPENFPEKTKVLFHIDFEKPILNTCKVTLNEILPKDLSLGPLIELGMNVPVLDISLAAFGDTEESLNGVLLVHTGGKIDVMLQAIDLVQHEKEVYGPHTIHRWPKPDTKLWFAIQPDKQTFICSDQPRSIQVALDALNDDSQLSIGELPINDLKSASILLASLDLNIGSIPNKDILQKGCEMINLSEKMAVTFHTEDDGLLKLQVTLQGKNEEDTKLASRMGDGLLAYVEQQIREDIPVQTGMKLQGDNLIFEATTSLGDIRAQGEKYLDKIEVPEEYGELLRIIGQKIQEMADKSSR